MITNLDYMSSYLSDRIALNLESSNNREQTSNLQDQSTFNSNKLKASNPSIKTHDSISEETVPLISTQNNIHNEGYLLHSNKFC